MVQASNRLGARSISTIKQPGLHADGNGLYLKVKPTGTKSWAYVFFLNGKRSLMGLGSASEVSLAEARDRRDEMRALVKKGIDPRGEKKASAAKGDAANAIEDTGRTDLFSNVAKALIEDLRPGWKSAKHGQQWTNTLEQHAGLIWDMPVADITVNHVLDVLRPIWITKSETATRVRSRIERVLAVAKSRGLRTGDNPAVWKENLEFMMAKRPTGQRGHHAAMPYQDVPEFMKELQTRPAMAARLLEIGRAHV